MPVKPRPAGKSSDVGVGRAEQLRHADQAGDRAGEQHRGRAIMRLTSTPLATAAASRQPGRPQVEAEAGAVEQEPVADADEQPRGR